GYSSPQTIYLDTLTVMDPDFSFVASYDIDNLPVDDIDLTVEHGYIQPVNSDLYVNPVTGNDSNSGINPGDPLKTITYAYKIIKSDSITPHRIYLANGTYSGSMNGEKLPLGPRSYISVIGSGIDSTFIDGEYNTGFFLGIGTLKNYTIENITFQHGKWNHPSGIYIQNNNFVRIKNFEIKDGGYSASGGITLIKIDLLILKNIFIKNIVSYGVLGLSNWAATTKTFTIENCIIQNNLPDEDPINTGLEGGGLKIGGNSSPPYSYIGKITNLQITDNLRIPDPGWGPGMIGGYTQSNYCKVDMINATIGYNTVQGEFGFAANANNGAELNVYNSIFYGDSLNELSLGYQNCPVPSEANISYSNFEGGFGNTYVWDSSVLNWLEGNIDADPKWDTSSTITYSLQWDSPCIDAGTPMYEFGMDYPYIKIEDEKIVLYKIDGDTIHLPQTDIAGNPRIVNGRIDMGAYEFQDTGVRIREQFLQNLNELNIDVFPNPFHSHTFISFVLVKKADVKVLIHDARGSVVKSLLDGSLPSGKYNLTWPGQDDSGNEAENGAYLVSVYVDGIKMGSEKVVKNSSR
ncbi:MAG: hypothetical protein KDC05_16880, partial [Bacteroidales bacterium]|nr:hypothetical protein [Bacteroidales bacterium]